MGGTTKQFRLFMCEILYMKIQTLANYLSWNGPEG